MPIVDLIPLHETTRKQYLNYALSVITSRALPDVRDGLKPVQRRILYAMYANLRLLPTARFRKSATVVGETMGKYHPHGDTAIYDAMARMAQDFSLRHPVVDGQGNFGSLDGDRPAAMRYTEARLQPIALSLLEEIRKQTVHFRPNYDATVFEPVVLPAQWPHLLVNGASGIAVGMATNIPPHNLGEVISALIALSQRPSTSIAKLMEHIQGPDFPTGGQVLNTKEELLKVYQDGAGPIDLRGTYRMGRLEGGKKGIIITSIPYGLSKSDLIEKIAEHIRTNKVPQLLDVRDESTEAVRIVLELRRGADPEAAIAYLFKHTPLQTRFHVNLTCLLPSDNPEVGIPQRVDLRTALAHFLDFRLDVVTKRLQFDLARLEKRIHILHGFARIFDALDEAIKMIRASKNKTDAAQRLMHRFQLDEEQTDAILETKLYRLSQLEIADIRAELEAKEKEAEEIRQLLDDEGARKRLVRKALRALQKTFADERRTVIAGPDPKHTYTAEDYIVKEDVHVLVSRDGWVKRQRSYSELGAVRVREGDEIGWALACSTRDTVGFFTNYGKAYTLRAEQLPNTTGYGDPIQKYFDFKDGERLVGVISMDERILPKPVEEPDLSPELFDSDGKAYTGPFAVAVSRQSNCLRFELAHFREPSTKNGRAFMRMRNGDQVLGVEVGRGDEHVCLASREGRALIFPLHQIPVFKNASKGVLAMRLEKPGEVLGFTLSRAPRQGLAVTTSRGRTEIIRPTKFEVSNRGNKGKNVIQRGKLVAITPAVVEMVLNGKKA